MRYQVVKQGKQWAVMNRDTNQVVEGGFFYRDSALDKLAEWSGELTPRGGPENGNGCKYCDAAGPHFCGDRA